MAHEYTVIIEEGEDGNLIGRAADLPMAFTQGRTLDELLDRMREVIALVLEELGEHEIQPTPRILGVHRIAV